MPVCVWFNRSEGLQADTRRVTYGADAATGPFSHPTAQHVFSDVRALRLAVFRGTTHCNCRPKQPERLSCAVTFLGWVQACFSSW